jgi:hypothetical protein
MERQNYFLSLLLIRVPDLIKNKLFLTLSLKRIEMIYCAVISLKTSERTGYITHK